MIQPNHKLNGLILAGGKSSRMGKDKGLLKYHDQEQVFHLSKLLTPFCQKTFISCREEQSSNYLRKELLILDQYDRIGPMGGILSAFHYQSDCAWLVVACDLVLLKTKTIQQLLEARNPDFYATLFQNQDYLEPLFAIYESRIFPHLLQAKNQHNYSISKLLRNLEIEILIPQEPDTLSNVNTIEEKKIVESQLSKK